MPQVLVGAQIVSQTMSILSGRKARKIQQQQQRAQNNYNKVKAKQAQMEQLGRVRAMRAQAVNLAEQTGTGDSTSLAGTAGGIVTTGVSVVGDIQSDLVFGQYVGNLQQEAVDAQGEAQLFGTAAAVFGSAADITGAYDKLFSSDTTDVKLPTSGSGTRGTSR